MDEVSPCFVSTLNVSFGLFSVLLLISMLVRAQRYWTPLQKLAFHGNLKKALISIICSCWHNTLLKIFLSWSSHRFSNQSLSSKMVKYVFSLYITGVRFKKYIFIYYTLYQIMNFVWVQHGIAIYFPLRLWLVPLINANGADDILSVW